MRLPVTLGVEFCRNPWIRGDFRLLDMVLAEENRLVGRFCGCQLTDERSGAKLGQ